VLSTNLRNKLKPTREARKGGRSVKDRGSDGFVLGEISLSGEKAELRAERMIGENFFGQLGKLSGSWFRDMVQNFDASFAGAAKGTELTLEFGVTLKLEGNIIQVIKAGAEADMKLQLKRALAP
jgi:hypothetical protein